MMGEKLETWEIIREIATPTFILRCAVLVPFMYIGYLILWAILAAFVGG